MKMTKRDKFMAINNVFEGLDIEGRDEILEFCKNEIAALDAKTVRAREKAAERRAESDTLTEGMLNVVAAADAPMTIEEIINAMPDEGLTPAKVSARMAKLVKGEVVTKETVKVNGRKLVAYAKA